jgi:hypothetical protein
MNCAVCVLHEKAVEDPYSIVFVAIVIGVALGKSVNADLQMCDHCKVQMMKTVEGHNFLEEARKAGASSSTSSTTVM